MKAELKRAADLVAFQRREALAREAALGRSPEPLPAPLRGGADLHGGGSRRRRPWAIFSNYLRRKRPGSVRGGSSPRWTRSLTLSSGSGFWPWRCWASPPRVWQRERRTASPDGGAFGRGVSSQPSRCTAWGGSNSKNDYTGRRTAMKSNGKLCPLGKSSSRRLPTRRRQSRSSPPRSGRRRSI